MHEVFGPIAGVFSFETEEEAIRLANKTEMGLSAYFYTGQLSRAWRVAEALEAGILTPHVARLTAEAQERTSRLVITDVLWVLSGERAIGAV